MSACPNMEGLLAERATGEMSAEDAARLDAHLETCEPCRTELRAYQQTFEMARLPPPEGRIAELDVSTFSAYQRRRRRRVAGFTIGAGFVAAAVAASVVIMPALLTLRSLPQQSHSVVTDSTYSQVEGTDVYQGSGTTQLAVSSESSDEILPEDAALAAFDELDTP